MLRESNKPICGCSFRNPTNAVGGLFIHSLHEAAGRLGFQIPPTQLVDRSYSAYKGPVAHASANPTNAVGGILGRSEAVRL